MSGTQDAQRRGDCFQAHTAVDRLGGQGMAQLVWMDVAQPGGGRGGCSPVDGAYLHTHRKLTP
jgi:hypothetical protein